MQTICPQCKSPLTVREAIHKTCTNCSFVEKRRSAKTVGEGIAEIRRNFDALVSEELRRRPD